MAVRTLSIASFDDLQVDITIDSIEQYKEYFIDRFVEYKKRRDKNFLKMFLSTQHTTQRKNTIVTNVIELLTNLQCTANSIVLCLDSLHANYFDDYRAEYDMKTLGSLLKTAHHTLIWLLLTDLSLNVDVINLANEQRDKYYIGYDFHVNKESSQWRKQVNRIVFKYLLYMLDVLRTSPNADVSKMQTIASQYIVASQNVPILVLYAFLVILRQHVINNHHDHKADVNQLIDQYNERVKLPKIMSIPNEVLICNVGVDEKEHTVGDTSYSYIHNGNHIKLVLHSNSREVSHIKVTSREEADTSLDHYKAIELS